MGMSLQHSPTRLPRRLPIGARYVVEGYGGGEGKLRVIARYLLLPDGNRINVPGELSRPASPLAQAARRRSELEASPAKTALPEGPRKILYPPWNCLAIPTLIGWRRAKPPSPSPSITRRRTPVAPAAGVLFF